MCADVFSENGHACTNVLISEDVMPYEVVSGYLTSQRTWIFVNLTASSLKFDNDTCIVLVYFIISHLNKKFLLDMQGT